MIVAPWGLPALWGETIYVLEKWEMTSCTSLGLVAQIFSGKEVDVAILALDSLVDEYLSQKGESKCYSCYEKYRSFIRESAKVSGYSELKILLNSFVKQFVECLELSFDPFVVICPAIGSPGSKWRFSGSPYDFEAVALYELGKLCIEKAYTRIVLDLTHGVNFMPAVTLKLAGELASLILAVHEGLQNGVELRVYNSDPKPPVSGTTHLNLNLVAKERIKSLLALHQLPPRLLDTKKSDLFKKRDELNSKYHNMVKLPLSTIYYPLPLALCEVVPKAGDSPNPLQILEEAFTLWCKNVSVSDKLMERLIALDPDAIYALLLLEAVRRRLEVTDKPPNLGDIKKLANLYGVVNESFYYLIMNEISRIEESLNQLMNTGWVPLSQLFSKDEGYKKNPDKRIMIAHAGLQKELVEVNIHTKQLRYRTDVKDILSNAGLLLKHM